MSSGDKNNINNNSYTTVWLYLKPVNCTLQNKIMNVMLSVFDPHKIIIINICVYKILVLSVFWALCI